MLMLEQKTEVPWLDYPRFRANQDKFPEAELTKYAGQHVAWSMDGAQILASAACEEGLESLLQERGIDPSRVVWAYVPGETEDGYLGGGFSE